MYTHQSTTPFGRRPLSLAMVASQTIAKECPAGTAVHKWEVFRAVCEGRGALGVSERALSVLNALLTFHPETVLTGQGDLIVFPSNQQLALRAHGMAPSTLRRHLAVLVDSAIVIRRDSPNGKRYSRKGSDGEEGQAFGFDLTPFVARAAEFEMHAKTVRDERRAVSRLRERITILRRDVVKMADMASEEGVPGNWNAIREIYASIIGRLPRLAASSVLEPIADELALLAAEASILLENHVNPEEKTTNESRDEHHIHNSNTKPPYESEPVYQGDRAEASGPIPEPSRPPRRSFPLSMVLDACPDIVDYARGGVNDWKSLGAAADVARGALGISPSAYEDAQGVMGREEAAVVVAAILQKGGAINNAGAYLRGLTGKAREGGFSPGPMLMALLKLRTRQRLSA